MLNFPFTAALMAGGQSQRMGYDKATARIADEPLWKRQLALLRELEPAQLFISGRPGATYPDAGCEVITDTMPGAGPLGGLFTALRHSSLEFLLVLAVDMPAMRADFLHALLIEAHTVSRSVIPQGNEGLEPLAAVYHTTCLPIAEASLQTGERSMRSLITRLQKQGLAEIRTIREDETWLFRNVNTPEELAAADAELRKKNSGDLSE